MHSSEEQIQIQKLTALMKDQCDNGDAAHDFAHILRVVNACKRIGLQEGADLSILIPAALLHDVVNVPKDHPDRVKASGLAAIEGTRILLKLGFSEPDIRRIATVITEHSFSLGMEPTSIESAVLQDADRLDAVGAIGIMRTVTCGALFGAKYYNAREPFGEDRPLDDKRFTIDHLYVKLFKLAEKMNTKSAKEEAHRRTKFMNHFVEQLRSEI